MCRIAAYLGPPLPLARLLYDADHSLESQSYRPREMVSGTVNVDGTGAAWWSGGDPRPLRYVTELPPWSDPNLPCLAGRLTGSPILATVRSATPGIPSGPGAVLPFVHDDLAGSHNGYLGRFRESTCGTLLARLPSELLGGLETVSDSALLFLLAVEARARTGNLVEAALDAVREASRICSEADAPASLNLVLATADRIVAIRHAVGVPSNSLYTLRSDDAAWLASEPLDDRDWKPVEAGRVVVMDDDGLRSRAADLRGATG